MSADVHAQLAAVMEALVLAAVAELHKQRRGGSDPAGDFGPPGEQSPRAANLRGENGEVCFAAILETLANEALGKIVNIVEQIKPRRGGKRACADEMPRVAVINVLKNACLEAEHSYDVLSSGRASPPAPAQDKAPDRMPFTPSVDVIDERGCVDMDVILECDGADGEPLGGWHSEESESATWEEPEVEAAEDVAAKPFACEFCGRRFTMRHNLRRHANLHTSGKSFFCSACGKGFTRATALKIHELAHADHKALPLAEQKPPPRLMCQFCPKSFLHAHNLRNHLRLHTGVRPYACDLCGKTFRQKVNLKIHARVHTGERPYACRQCGKSFTQQSSLAAHARTHSGERPFVCDVCAKTFGSNNSLKIHLRVHTGERPYACDVCHKTFIQGSHMRTHKSQVHLGGKLCDRCGKAYANGRNLKAHKCVYA
ncbi:uncharacterized protein LOC144005400 [Festucalex cinctus]